METKIDKLLLIIVVLMIMLFPISSSAAEKLTVNSKPVAKGDIVTFEYYMSDVKDPIEAAGAYINYNPEFLEYVDGSIGFDVLENAMMNISEGSIYYCAINIYDGFDFNDEGLVVTASFKVLDTASGATIVSNTFDEIFTFENEEEDLTPDDYTSRQVVYVNGYSENKSTHSGINAKDIGQTPDDAMIMNNSLKPQYESSLNNNVIVLLFIAFIVLFIIVFAIFIIIKKKFNG